MAARATLNIVVVAATGGLGSRVTVAAVRAGHNVTAFARSQTKVDETFPADVKASPSLRIVLGDATDLVAMQSALEGADTVIECLGNSDRDETINTLIEAAAACVPPSPALIVLGGSPALSLPSGEPATAEPSMARMAGLARMHLATLEKLRVAKGLGAWAQVCPSRMVPSETGEPSGLFRIRPNVIDLEVYIQGAALTYEDVAAAIVSIASVRDSGFDGQQVAFALTTSAD